ncbi:hypothetical protein CIB84_009176 [Bambusicola thoracicus]|uniref:Uncharacterized protein n=1 Tax=Bambusicola thoracicus TaxID=9083 RepID=A0A2P4SSJ4_BAMTH|nr:hypothetical protein CIB84_009176 [Bambusicola thoracicus]
MQTFKRKPTCFSFTS